MSTLIPHSPYKGLIPYSEEDAQFFFGREQKREIIAANLLASRLTVLHGPSGVGKSSVLRAGVAQQLRARAEQSAKDGTDPDFAVVVFSSWRDDPVDALATRVRESVARITNGAGLDPLPPSRELAKTLQTWTRRDPQENRPDMDLLIILDQFEEYFLYHPSEKGDGTFATEFARAINNPELRVNFLISIREDALAKLERFKGSIPTLFENRLSLEHLDRDAAREAIIKPIDQFNLAYRRDQPVSIEPALVEAILQQVKTGQVFLGEAGRGVVDAGQSGGRFQIETPFLQLVLTRLWDEEMAGNSSVLRLETLNRLGGAARIVRTHLDQTMETLPSEAKDIASRIFFHLVTPSGTKIAHTVADLATFAKVSQQRLDPVLDKLADNSERILRPVDPSPNQPGVQRFEIFHDVLAPAILDWRTRYMQARLQAQAEKRAAKEAAEKEQEAAHLAKLQQAEQLAEAQRARAEEQFQKAQAERRHARQLRSAMAGLCILLVGTLTAFFWGYRQTLAANTALNKADAEKNAAVLSREAADNARGEAFAEKSKAQFERDTAQKAKDEAIKQKAIAEKARVEEKHSKEYAITERKLAVSARLEAEKQRKIAESGELAAEAYTQLKTNPELAVLLAREAVKQTGGLKESDMRAGAEALHAAMQSLPERATFPIESDHQRMVLGSFTRDGKRLVTYNADRSLKISEVGSTKPAITLTGEFKPSLPFALSDDGKFLATAGPDGRLLLWDTEGGKLLDRTSDRARISPETLNFSNSDKLIASGFSFDVWQNRKGRKNEVLVWNIDARKFGASDNVSKSIYSDAHKDSPIRNLTFSADGHTVAFVQPNIGEEQTAAFVQNKEAVILFSLASGRVTSKFGCMQIPLTATPVLLAFNSEGSRFALACDDGGVQVWDVTSTGSAINKLRLNGYPLGEKPLTFDSKLEYLATAGADFTVNVRKLWHDDVRERLKVDTLVGHKGEIFSSTFTPDGKKLVTASYDKTTNIWTLGPGHELPTFFGKWIEVAGIAFSPDGKYLAGAIADPGHPTAEIWDTTPNGTGRTLSGHSDKVWAVVYNKQGTLIATGSGGGRFHANDYTAKIWNAKTGALIKTLAAHPNVVREVSFSPDGSLLATACEDGRARIWNVASGNLIRTLPSGEGETPGVSDYVAMRGVAFSSDGGRLATANGEGTATVWDIGSGNKVCTLIGHSAVVWKVAFSPDGDHIATASHDGTAKVWNAFTGQELFTLTGHTDKLWGVTFSRDGKRIATASSDKTARIWDAKSGNELLVLTGHSAGVNRVAFSPDDKRLATSSEDGTVRLYDLDVNALVVLARQRVPRELTAQERRDYVPEHSK